MSIPEKLLKLLKFQFPEKTKAYKKQWFLVNRDVHGLNIGGEKKMIELFYDTTSFTVFGSGK